MQLAWADRPENKAARLEYMKQWRRENPLNACVHSLVNGARSRAKKSGLGFDAEVINTVSVLEMIPDDMKCPCCKVKMIARVEKGRDMRSISLDRVDNDKGYVAGNVAVLCALCNQRKRDMGVHELRLLVRYIESHGT